MTDAGAASGHRRLRNVAIVVVPCVLTATAFGIASHFGLVGDLPFWMLLVLLALAQLVDERTVELQEIDRERAQVRER